MATPAEPRSEKKVFEQNLGGKFQKKFRRVPVTDRFSDSFWVFLNRFRIDLRFFWGHFHSADVLPKKSQSAVFSTFSEFWCLHFQVFALCNLLGPLFFWDESELPRFPCTLCSEILT